MRSCLQTTGHTTSHLTTPGCGSDRLLSRRTAGSRQHPHAATTAIAVAVRFHRRCAACIVPAASSSSSSGEAGTYRGYPTIDWDARRRQRMVEDIMESGKWVRGEGGKEGGGARSRTGGGCVVGCWLRQWRRRACSYWGEGVPLILLLMRLAHTSGSHDGYPSWRMRAALAPAYSWGGGSV